MKLFEDIDDIEFETSDTINNRLNTWLETGVILSEEERKNLVKIFIRIGIANENDHFSSGFKLSDVDMLLSYNEEADYPWSLYAIVPSIFGNGNLCLQLIDDFNDGFVEKNIGDSLMKLKNKLGLTEDLDTDDIELEPTDSETKVEEFLKVGVLLTDKEKEKLEENEIGEWLYEDDYGIVDFDILLTVNTGIDSDEYPWALCVIEIYNGEPRLEFVDAVTDWFANECLSTSLKEYKEKFHLEEDLDVDLELDDPEIWFENDGDRNRLQIFLSDKIKKNILDVIDKSQDGGVVENDEGFGGYRLTGYHGMYWGAIHHVENNWYVDALSKYGWYDHKLVVYEQIDEHSGSGVLEIEHEDVEKFLKDVGLSEDSISVIMNREKVTEDIDDIDFDESSGVPVDDFEGFFESGTPTVLSMEKKHELAEVVNKWYNFGGRDPKEVLRDKYDYVWKLVRCANFGTDYACIISTTDTCDSIFEDEVVFSFGLDYYVACLLIDVEINEDVDIDLDADEPTIEINQYGQGILTKENVSKLYNVEGIKTESSIYKRFYINCLYIRNQTLEQFSDGLFFIGYNKSASSYHGHDCYQISKLGNYDDGEKFYDGSIEITSEVALEIGLTEGDLNTLKNSGLAYDEMADMEDDDDVDIDDNDVEEIFNESDEDHEDSFDLDDSTVINPSMIRHNKNFIEYTYEDTNSIKNIYNIVLDSPIYSNQFTSYEREIQELLNSGIEMTSKVQILIRGYKEENLCDVSFGVYHRRKGTRWYSYYCEPSMLSDGESEVSEFLNTLKINIVEDEQTDIITEDVDSDIDLEDTETMEQKYGPTELLRLYIVGTDECAVVDNYVFEMDSFGDEYFVDALFRVNEDGSISKLDYPVFDTNAEEDSFCRTLLSHNASKETKESLLTRFNIQDIPERDKYDNIQDCIGSLSLENGWEDYESFMTYLSNTGY